MRRHAPADLGERVYDAVQGLIAEGHTRLADYVDVQPFPTGRYAEALLRGRRTAG